MILLFGEKAAKSNSTHKNSNIKNHPVENSGILANRSIMRGLLDANEYDVYMFSQQAEIDYSMYSEGDNSIASIGFMSEFSDAVSTLSEGVGYSADSFGGCDCSCSCSGSFASFC